MASYIDPSLARKCFDYDPDSGELTRIGTLETRGAKAKGKRLHVAHGGKKYYKHGVFGLNAYEHRIIWVWMTGEQPETIDHVDGNGLNNKWSNLRNVSHRVNLKNQKTHITNTSGKMGVCYRKDTGRWRARIMVDDKMISLGTFPAFDEATEARRKAELEYGFLQPEKAA